ncbi:MAG: hypothetical protein ACHQHN_08305 [Sphingobacteriales bacterium]
MKPIMAFFCIVLLCISCKKNHVTPLIGYRTNAGELVGYNMRMCPEPDCGGMIVHIDDDTSKNAPDHYLYSGTLPDFGISNATKFPVNVTLTWKRDTGVYGSYNFIVISKIKLR